MIAKTFTGLIKRLMTIEDIVNLAAKNALTI